MIMLGILGNRWRSQEWLLFLVASMALNLLVLLAGGDISWWGAVLTGFGLGAFIDIAERVGRRRERDLHEGKSQ